MMLYIPSSQMVNDKMVNNMMLHKYNTSNNITAFSTMRSGGVSTGNYASFNANHYCGDEPKNVLRNRELLCEALGIEQAHLIVPHQTHKTVTRIIDNEFLTLSANEQKEALEGVDAVCTNMKNICVCVSTADCIPILLYDETTGVISAVHAGWRGTVARIVEENIKVLQTTYGIDPQNLHAIIGPGISLEAFEVGDEVYEAFKDANFEMEKIAKRYPAPNSQKWHLDLPLCNKLQLLNIGLQEENIFLSNICTFNNSEEFFSARKLTINSGRILNGIVRQ